MVALMIFNSIPGAIFVTAFCSCLHHKPDILHQDRCLLTLYQYTDLYFFMCHSFLYSMPFVQFNPIFSLERSSFFFYYFLSCPPKARWSFSANFVGAHFILLSKLWLKTLYIDSIQVQIIVGINRMSNCWWHFSEYNFLADYGSNVMHFICA